MVAPLWWIQWHLDRTEVLPYATIYPRLDVSDDWYIQDWIYLLYREIPVWWLYREIPVSCYDMKGDTCMICKETLVWSVGRYPYDVQGDTCMVITVILVSCLFIFFDVYMHQYDLNFSLMWYVPKGDSHKKKWVKHEVRSKATRIEQEENRHSRRLVYRCSTHEESVETSKLCIPHHNWHESTTTYAALGVFPQPKQLVAWIQAGINTSFTRMFENRLWYHMKHP